MTPDSPPPTVDVRLSTVDAAVHVDPETRQVRLLLNPNQTIESAFSHARRLLKGVHPDVLRRLIRQAMPDVMHNLADELGDDGEHVPVGLIPPPPQVSVPREPWWASSAARAGLVATGVVVVGGAAFGLGALTERHEATAAFADASSRLASPVYQAFSRAGVHCDQVAPFRDSCVDIDGTSMDADILTNPTQVEFRFFYDTHHFLTVRSFSDAARADSWVKRQIVPPAAMSVRVATMNVSGNDKARCLRWAKVIADQTRSPVVSYEAGMAKVLYQPKA